MPPMYGGSSRMMPATSPPTGNKVDGADQFMKMMALGEANQRKMIENA